MRRLVASVAVFLVLSGGALRAQTTDASLTGRVTDPQKAIIVDAKVAAINVGTNVRYEGTSNSSGDYYITNLPPGSYRIEVEKSGFKTVIKPGVVLHVQDTIEVNFEMTVGSVSETVTVSAGASPIDTTDGTVSTTIDRDFAENLPLNGRSFQTLLLLTPGTTLVNESNGDGGTFSVNGQRANSNNFTVDGVSANVGGYLNANAGTAFMNGANPNFTTAGTTQGMVSVDALQEFKIQTSTYAPEFGRQPGGQVSLLTRSGTNDFHGTAFDYLRNNVFDASNWFNGYTNNPPLPKGKERQNDFGGTFGGPVQIPGVYSGKDKTFFFFSYEGLRLLQPTTGDYTVPSSALRQEAAPAFQPLLNFWPLPNPNGPVSGDTAEYTLDASQPTNFDSYAIRIDHSIGERLRFFGRYADTASNFETLFYGGPGIDAESRVRSRGLTIGSDISVSPAMNDEVRLNYTDNSSGSTLLRSTIGGGTLYNPSILFPEPLVQGPDFADFELSLPDITNDTDVGPSGEDSQRQINVIDNLSRLVGSHQLKWGVDYRRLSPKYLQVPAAVQYYVESVSDLETGTVSQTYVNAYPAVYPTYINFSAYAQDTWRVSSRLTLTYGIRWELNPTPGVANGLSKYFLNIVGISDPATATLAPAGSPLYKTTYDDFAPRLGLAYQLRQSPGHETVVRGGFGIFYDMNSQTFAQNIIFASGAGAFGGSGAPYNELPFPVANDVLTIPSALNTTSPPYFRVFSVNPDLGLPYTLEWNVSIEQALGQGQSLTASYVGSAGYDLLREDYLRDFSPSFTNVEVVRNASSSNYQALQLQLNRRLAHGLQALVSYTYSHSIDNSSDGQTPITGFSGGALPNPNLDRGNSDFDLRHAFRAAATYNIPTWDEKALAKALLGGWSADAIGLAQTGLPVDLIGASGLVNARPDVVPGEPLYLYGAQCAAAHADIECPGGMGFNPGAFESVPTSGGIPVRQGDFGRNVMRGFGAWQMDFAVHRQFNLTDRVNLQFRGEAFNLFNHPNFGSINARVGQATFGEATQTLNQSLGGVNQLYQVGGPRSIQLALKLVF